MIFDEKLYQRAKLLLRKNPASRVQDVWECSFDVAIAELAEEREAKGK